jgi:hypothetical protein
MSPVLDPPRHRFSRAQYELMVESGIVAPEGRLELLEGEIIDMTLQKSRHATAVTWDWWMSPYLVHCSAGLLP